MGSSKNYFKSPCAVNIGHFYWQRELP